MPSIANHPHPMFAHFTIATRDLPASVRFFEQTLGFAPIRRAGNIDVPSAWLDIGGGQELHLLELPDFEVSPFEREFGRHFAFFHNGGDFDGLKQRLVEAGAELIDPLRETPFERFFFRDPNGYVFEVIDREGHAKE